MAKLIYKGNTLANSGSVDILNTMEEINANTSETAVAGANAVKEALGGAIIRVNEGVIEWKEQGADTFTPFKSSGGNSAYRTYSETVGVHDTVHIAQLHLVDSKDPNNIYEEYIYFNPSSYKFTVLKECTLVLTGMIVNTDKGSGNPIGAIYYNGTQVVTYVCGYYKGDTAYNYYSIKAKPNDVFYFYNTNTRAFPYNKGRVYITTDGDFPTGIF